jgi:hypothetical protein
VNLVLRGFVTIASARWCSNHRSSFTGQWIALALAMTFAWMTSFAGAL